MERELEGTITRYFGQLRDGDRQAAEKLWEYFGVRLLGIARKSLNGRSSALVCPEDAVQSAFVSFWQRAEQGAFAGHLDRDNLWRLLCVITIRKSLKMREREQRQKRGGGKVRNEAALAVDDGGGFKLDDAVGRVPGPEFDLWCEELMQMLDEPSREVVALKLMGHKNHEIAEILNCTECKVERKLRLTREIWQRECLSPV